MRKHTQRIKRPAHPPCLVVLETVPELGLAAHLAIEAIKGGWATRSHFDDLADVLNMLIIGMEIRDDKSIKAACEIGLMALQNIRAREKETGKIGATGDEIKAVQAMLAMSDDWWPRQSGRVFAQAYRTLKMAGK